MDCPKCKLPGTHVLKSIPMGDGTIKRRRECFECDHRFTTDEYLRTDDNKKRTHGCDIKNPHLNL